MRRSPLEITLPDADATAALGRMVAQILGPGDILLLEGPVGAGKTHFARALIQSILTTPEDVPSPTFTLVQTYETTRGLLWHADLYRLSDSNEIEELGLTEAFETAMCLIEWPDRLGEIPPQALTISFRDQGGARGVTLAWQGGNWAERLETGLSHV